MSFTDIEAVLGNEDHRRDVVVAAARALTVLDAPEEGDTIEIVAAASEARGALREAFEWHDRSPEEREAALRQKEGNGHG